MNTRKASVCFILMILMFQNVKSVIVFEMTYNSAGFFEDREKVDDAFNLVAPTIHQKYAFKGDSWAKKPKTAPTFALTKEIAKSIRKACLTKVPDILALHFQEVKNAGTFKNAMMTGMNSAQGHLIDIELLRPAIDPDYLQVENQKFRTKQDQEKRQKERTAFIKDRSDHEFRLAVIAVGIEQTDFKAQASSASIKYKCLHVFIFQLVASCFCFKLKPDTLDRTVSDLNFETVGITQYGRSGEEKSSGLFGKTFGFKGGFTTRITGRQGSDSFSLLFTNVHLSATNLNHRRSELMEMFRYAYAHRSSKTSWQLNRFAQDDLANLPSVHFFAGDFNSRTLNNFKKDDSLKLSFPDGLGSFMKECWAGYELVNNDMSTSYLPAALEYTLNLCPAPKKPCSQKKVNCADLLKKIIRFEEFFEFFSDAIYAFQLLMEKTLVDVELGNLANKFLFSPMSEQKITFLPSYSHTKETAKYKTDKQISYTDRLFYVCKAILGEKNKNNIYPLVTGLGYWSDKFLFISDHAAVLGLFEITFQKTLYQDLIPWSLVKEVPTIPSDEELESFDGKTIGTYGTSVVNFLKSIPAFTTYQAIYDVYEKLPNVWALNQNWVTPIPEKEKKDLSKTIPQYQIGAVTALAETEANLVDPFEDSELLNDALDYDADLGEETPKTNLIFQKDFIVKKAFDYDADLGEENPRTNLNFQKDFIVKKAFV